MYELSQLQQYMSQNSQLIVSLHIHPQKQLRIHFTCLEEHHVDKVLTKFIKDHKIKEKAIPYIKEHINVQINKHHSNSNNNNNTNNNNINNNNSKQQNGKKKSRQKGMKQMKVKDLQLQMQEQMKSLKIQRKVEKWEPQLCQLFAKLSHNRDKIEVKKAAMWEQLIKKHTHQYMSYDDFKTLIVKQNAHYIIEYLK